MSCLISFLTKGVQEMQDLRKQLERIGLDNRVFEDFVTLGAISIHNQGAFFDENREQEYLKIINTYDKADQKALCECLAKLVMLLDSKPADVLGQLYTNMGFTDIHKAQFFTPDPIATFMAKSIIGDIEKQLEHKPFITLCEPACGAGGMILAFVKEVLALGYNPAETLWVQATDISRTASMMCYLQLSLWNVPAQVIVGDSLSLELHELWHTPAHVWFDWESKLKAQAKVNQLKSLVKDTATASTPTKKTQEVLFKKPKQVNSDINSTENAQPKRKKDVADAVQIGFDF